MKDLINKIVNKAFGPKVDISDYLQSLNNYVEVAEDIVEMDRKYPNAYEQSELDKVKENINTQLSDINQFLSTHIFGIDAQRYKLKTLQTRLIKVDEYLLIAEINSINTDSS